MELRESGLATVTEARAYQLDDVIVVKVAGTVPSACHEVSIEQALADVEPPGFIARESIHPAKRCAPAVTEYESVSAFRIGTARETVVVHHAGGRLDVDVVVVPVPEGASSARQLLVELEAHEPSEAVGYSSNWDLGEAMKDAIERLPKRDDVFDWLYQYRVVDVGAEVGGIAGFNRLRVTVRG